jgi:hypothetical protein
MGSHTIAKSDRRQFTTGDLCAVRSRAEEIGPRLQLGQGQIMRKKMVADELQGAQ